MMNFEMNRDQVEKLLDLQVRTGNMSEKIKEEKLREYDMLMQQRNGGAPGQPQYNQPQFGQPGGMPGQPQYNQPQFGQPGEMPGQPQYNQPQFGQPGEMPGQPQFNQQQFNQPDNGRYPRIKPHPEGYLNGVEMIAVLILAILVVVAGKMGSASMLGLTMGIIFTYIGAKIIIKDLNAGRSINYISVIAVVVGVLMLVYGFFKLFASSEAQDSLDNAGNRILPFFIIVIGFAIIIGSFIRSSSMKKKYNIPVQATCVQLVIPRHASNHSPRTRSPIYEYWYNGELRRTFMPYFTNRGLPAVDEVREIFVSEGDDGGFYDPKLTGAVLVGATLLGSFFILMGGLVVFLTYFR